MEKSGESPRCFDPLMVRIGSGTRNAQSPIGLVNDGRRALDGVISRQSNPSSERRLDRAWQSGIPLQLMLEIDGSRVTDEGDLQMGYYAERA